MKPVYIVVIIVIGLVIGLALRANFKRDLRANTRSEFSSVCSDKQECKVALGTHFEGCFDTVGTDLFGRRIDKSALVACVNSRAGSEVLSATAR